MTASLLLLAGLTIGAQPDKATLPTRMLSLPTDPGHLRVAGKQLYISGFHSGKLVMARTGGEEPARELRLDAYESYRDDSVKGEVREIRQASGGDLVLADGKIFVGQ